MKNRLFETLRSFNNIEITEFEDFLHSPFINKNKKAAALFGFLKDFHPDYNSPQLDKKLIYNRFYDTYPFEDWKVRNLFSDLHILAEDFLSYRKFKHDTGHFERIKAEELILKKLYKPAYKCIRKLETEIEKSNIKDEDYFFKKYLTENLKNRIYYSIHDEPDSESNKRSNEFSRKYFLISYLRSYSYILDISGAKNDTLRNYDNFLKYILKYMEDNESGEHPHIRIFYLLIMSITDESRTEHYFKLKEVLSKHYREFSDYVIFDFYLYLQNYCWKKISFSGNKEFGKELLNLYKWIIDHKIIELEENFLHTYFNNFVNAGLMNGEHEWTLKFIENYKYRLRDEIRETAVNFNMAKIYMKKGDHNTAIEMLSNVKPIDPYFKVQYKILQVINYYEMNYLESALNMNETLRKMLARMKIFSESYKQNFYNFVIYFQKLMLLRNKYNKLESGMLYDNIKKIKGIIQKDWLLEKINNLKR